MKVFLSWSGELSRAVAEAFKELLEDTLQTTQPWMSSTDIESGGVWPSMIFSNLLESKAGVLFLTSQNYTAPWILFEAGALMKQVNKTKVRILVIDCKPVDLNPPLGCFQASTMEKEDVRKIVAGINNELENPIENDRWKKNFNLHWPKFNENCTKAIENSKTKSTAPPRRTTEDMLEEIVLNTRGIVHEQMSQKPVEKRIMEVLSGNRNFSQSVVIPPFDRKSSKH